MSKKMPTINFELRNVRRLGQRSTKTNHDNTLYCNNKRDIISKGKLVLNNMKQHSIADATPEVSTISNPDFYMSLDQ